MGHDTALAHLNRAGAQGWELVSVTEDGAIQGTSELHRYHLETGAGHVPSPAADPQHQPRRPARHPRLTGDRAGPARGKVPPPGA